jgi:hypothetical protein
MKKQSKTAAELEASIKVEMEDICDWPTDMTISVQPDGDSWKVAVTFQSPCARRIAAAGLGQSTGSPGAMAPSMKSKGNATKKMISAIRFPPCLRIPEAIRMSESHSRAALTITALDLLPGAATVPHDRAPRRDRAYQASRRMLEMVGSSVG